LDPSERERERERERMGEGEIAALNPWTLLKYTLFTASFGVQKSGVFLNGKPSANLSSVPTVNGYPFSFQNEVFEEVKDDRVS
jgi:hypothetical protein